MIKRWKLRLWMWLTQECAEYVACFLHNYSHPWEQSMFEWASWLEHKLRPGWHQYKITWAYMLAQLQEVASRRPDLIPVSERVKLYSFMRQ